MKILLAVDGSEFTKRMLAYVGAHEQFLGAGNQFTAMVVTARVPPQVTHHIDHATLEDYYAEQAAAVLQPVKAFADHHHWDLTLKHELGPAAEAIAKAAEDGHFDLLAARYKYLRTFTPAVIAALPLTGNTASPDVAALLDAVDVLRELNAAGRTSVPEQATTPAATSFVPARWRGYLDATRGQGRGAAYRH